MDDRAEQWCNRLASLFGTPSTHSWIAEHGRTYSPPRSSQIIGPEKQCFATAGRAALAYSGTYVEGIAILSEEIPFGIDHAWLIDAAGAVIETTWRTPGISYFGVAIEAADLAALVDKTGEWGAAEHLARQARPDR